VSIHVDNNPNIYINDPISNRQNMPSYQDPIQNYQLDNNNYESVKYNEPLYNNPPVNEEIPKQSDYSSLNNSPYDKGFNTIDAIGNQPNLSHYSSSNANQVNYNLNPSSQNSNSNYMNNQQSNSNNNQSNNNNNNYMYNNNNNGSSNYYVRLVL